MIFSLVLRMYFSMFADTSSFVMLLIYKLVFLFGVRMLLQYMFLSLFVVKFLLLYVIYWASLLHNWD